MIYYIIIALIIKPIDSNSILKENTDHTSDLIDFTLNIIKNEFNQSQTALIIHIDQDANANVLLEKMKHQIALYSINMINFTAQFDGIYPNYKPDLTIIFVNEESYQNIDAIIFGIELFSFWNIRGTFLVVGFGSFDGDMEWLRHSFDEFWERQALRVYICFWSNGLKLFTYNPFLDNYSIDISNRSASELWLSQKPINMYGYPFKTMSLDLVMPNKGVEIEENGKKRWIGFDGYYQECICQGLNASIEVRQLSYYYNEEVVQNTDVKIPTSVYLKLLMEVYDFDMMFNAALVYDDDSGMDEIFLYDKDEMQILIKKEKQIPMYLYIFLIVDFDVWVATFSSFFAVSVAIVIVKKINHTNGDVGTVFLDNYRLLLNESPPARNRRYQERAVLILWIFYCIIFVTLFQTIFMTSLVAPKFYPEMQTLQDLYQTKTKIITNEFIKFKLSEILFGQHRMLLNHLVTEDISKYSQNIDWITRYEGDNGFMISKINIYELFAKDKSAEKSYYILKETPLPGVVSYMIRKDKFYYVEIKMILSRIQDAGLHIHWRKYNYGLQKTTSDNNSSNNNDKFAGTAQVLQFEHLQSAFMLLIFGYFVAIIIFGLELVLKKCYN